MPNASRTVLNEIDESHSPQDIPVGISGVEAVLPMGPFNRPDLLITSWPQWVALYGGLQIDNDAPLLAKRALERGSQLRVCRVGHYTTISDPATLTALVATTGLMKKVVTATAVAAGHTWNIVIDGTTFSQVYTTSAINTANLLAAKINAAVAAGTLPTAQAAIAALSTEIDVVPNGVAVVTSTTGGVASPVVTITDVSAATMAGVSIGTLKAKYAGVKYNNVVLTIANASNGKTNSFNIVLTVVGDSSRNKTFENISIPGTPSIAASNFMDKTINSQESFTWVYADLSAMTGPIRPVNGTWRLTGGSDGGAVTVTDYAGDSASNTGLQSFNGIDDMMQIAALDNSSTAWLSALAGYAAGRRDLSGFFHFDNSLVNANAYVSARDASLVDTSFIDMFAGGLIISDPFNPERDKPISEIGDILGIAAYSDFKYGTHYSFAGTKRGVILNALGVVNNFGSAGAYLDRNYMAQHGINVVCVSNKRILLKGNFTAQVDNSQLSFSSIRRMIIGLKKTLGLILERYVEEPNDIPTWKALYLEAKPLMKSYVDKRAIFDWDWQGDQFASSIDDLTINLKQDVLNGKYRAKLFMHAINSLQELTLDVILSSSGVSFEDNLSSLNN